MMSAKLCKEKENRQGKESVCTDQIAMLKESPASPSVLQKGRSG